MRRRGGRGAARGAAPVRAVGSACPQGVGRTSVARAQVVRGLSVRRARHGGRHPSGGGVTSAKTLGVSAAEGRSWRGACRRPELGVAGTPGTDPRHRSPTTGTDGRAGLRREGFGLLEELLGRLPGGALGGGEQRHLVGVPLELVQRVTGHRTVEVVMKRQFRPGRKDFRAANFKLMPTMLADGGARRSVKDEMRAILERTTARTWNRDKVRLMEMLERLP